LFAIGFIRNSVWTEPAKNGDYCNLLRDVQNNRSWLKGNENHRATLRSGAPCPGLTTGVVAANLSGQSAEWTAPSPACLRKSSLGLATSANDVLAHVLKAKRKDLPTNSDW